MDKVNVHQLKAPEEKLSVIDVTDESNPGVTVRLELIEPNISIVLAMVKELEAQSVLYLGPEPVFVPCEPIPFCPEEEELQLACAIYIMQKKKVYPVEEILILMRKMPKGMLKAIGAAKTVMENYTSLLMDPTPAPTTAPLPSTQENQGDIGLSTNE